MSINKNKIKEIVIEQEWSGDEAKSGDEYRSLSRQIDNFLKFMDDKTTPLYWMPIDIMTDNEIAQIICKYLKRNEKNKSNRLLLNNLNYEGVKYNYFHLVADTPSIKQTREMIYEVTPGLRNAQQWKIKEVMTNISDLWESDTTYIRKLSDTENWLHDIVACVLSEKGMYFLLGLGFTNPRYIEEFIDVVSYAAKLTIQNMIIFNDNVNAADKIKNLKIIDNYVIEEMPYMKEYVENSRISYRELREKFPRNENDDMLSMYFALYMHRKTFYHEISAVSSILNNDLPNFNLPELGEWKNKKVGECSTQALRKLLFADKMNDLSIKVQRTQQFIKKHMENGEHLQDDMQTVQIVFTAIYHSKASYQEKTVNRMVCNLLENTLEYPLKNLILLFLNMKIEQIYFLKRGIGDTYAFYTSISNNLNKLLLLPYSTWDDEEAYKRIYHIGYDFLYPFAKNEQYGLIL